MAAAISLEGKPCANIGWLTAPGAFDASGIRKVFDLGATMRNPINLSIGQPDFDVPEPVKQAAIEAIESGRNGYALSQGLPALREKLLARVRRNTATTIATCWSPGAPAAA